MQDCASSKPKVTNYDLENEVDIDDDDDDDVEVHGAAAGMSDSDISDDESNLNSVINSIITDKSGATHTKRSSTGNATRSAKKTRVPRRSPTVVDDDPSSSIAAANKAAADRFSEMTRHNKALEDIEKGRYDLERKRDEREAGRLDLEQSRLESMSWKTKTDQLEYQVKLISKYHEVKQKFGWTDEQILRHFPNMREVIENERSANNTEAGV